MAITLLDDSHQVPALLEEVGKGLGGVGTASEHHYAHVWYVCGHKAGHAHNLHRQFARRRYDDRAHIARPPPVFASQQELESWYQKGDCLS